MSIHRFRKFFLLFILLAGILACAPFSAGSPEPAATLNALYTSAAQTLAAMSTQAASTLSSQPSATNTLSILTTSPVAINTFTTTPPILPTVKCDAASFVTDITYPDGAVIGRGIPFTKIWRIKNIGTCTWTSSYSIVYESGERFGTPPALSLPTSVGPGQTVDLAINLLAPAVDGRYRGNWKLRNASGLVFGVGTSGTSNFYVDVNVTGYTVEAYSFTDGYCDANWKSETNNLPCPGSEGDDRGFVRLLNAPKMEDGESAGRGLLVYPNKSPTGLITAKFPRFTVKTGDRFQALVTCQFRATDCNVLFRLEYQIGSGDIKTLGQWHEVYEGRYYPVNFDLSSLSGETVKFILTVLANGTSHDDFALWINPRITRQSAQALTSTFTVTPSPTNTATATPTATFTATPTSTETPTLKPAPP